MKWISIKDRLPPPEIEVLLFQPRFGCCVGSLQEWGDFTDCVEGLTMPNVTHWMPLPEPPKENE